MYIPWSFVSDGPPKLLFLFFHHTYHCQPNNPWHLLCHCNHHSVSTTAAVPHPLLPFLIPPHLQRHHHHTRHRLSVLILYYTPLENLGMLYLLLRSTSLFPTISCAWSSNLYTLIYDFSDQFWSPCSILLAITHFSWSNPLYFSHSDLILSLRATLLDPLLSDMLGLLLSTSFFSILLHSDSIISDHFSQLCLLCSIRPVSHLLIYDFSTHYPLWFICSVMLSWIRLAGSYYFVSA